MRIAWKKNRPTQYAMYFNCQTTLVDDFKFLFPTEFTYEGNRAIVFERSDEVAMETLGHCVARALAYHQTRK